MLLVCLAKFTVEVKIILQLYGSLQSGYFLFFYRRGKEWKHIRSSASKQIVPRVANYAPGLCEIGDGFVEYVRRKRGPDGLLEDVSSALVKWAFQG